MDYYTIMAQKTLIRNEHLGKRIDSIRLHEKSLYLDLEGETALKLACIPDMPYIMEFKSKYVPIRNARDWNSNRLFKKTLSDISLTHGDRVTVFSFDSGDSLIFEMTGRHTNIILIDSQQTIVSALRTITGKESGIREIRTGKPYIYPPHKHFPELTHSQIPSIVKQLLTTDIFLLDALSSQVCSGSKLLARETITRDDVDPVQPANTFTEDTLSHLVKTLIELVKVIENGGERATIIFGNDSLPRDIFPLKLVSAGPNDIFMDTLNVAIEYYAREREVGLQKRGFKTSILTSLSREEKSLKQTIHKIKRERGEDSEPDLLEKKANTILTNLHLIKKGTGIVRLPDPYGNGEVEIELDPSKDANTQAKRFFTRARKLRSAVHHAKERIARIEQRIEEIRAELSRVETLDDLKALKTLAGNYSRRVQREKVSLSDQPFPRRFTSVAGLEIIVGRNDRENDDIVKWARKEDIWFHAQGVGGSHVILRSPGKKQQPDHKSIEQAAAIAAYYSKAKTSSIVPVVSTPLKYVVKRKGQAPGEVTYTREKVVFVEPKVSIKDNEGTVKS